MKTKNILLLSVLLLAACAEGQKLQSENGFAVITEAQPGERIATYAGGCFWAMQECMMELKGVNKVISGYAGGQKTNPTYAEVLSGTIGYAESVQVYYNPEIISFKQLTEAFFHAHDPTQIDRQGPDIGPDYRSIAFFRSAKEFNIIAAIIKKIDSSGIYKSPVATELLPYKTIYGAEMEHQDYYKNNSLDAYIRNVSKPKVLKLRQEMKALIKNEYLN
jgi:peptide-methionine (S)-S-oxide reductase